MLFFLPALVGILTVALVAGAYTLGRELSHNLPMQAGAARMPEGAAQEYA